MPDRFHIRKADLHDIAFLEACAQEAFAPYVKAIGRKPAPMVFDFRGNLGKVATAIVVADGTPAGYLVWQLGSDCLLLESIAILPAHQGGGFARRALLYLETIALDSGLQAIELYTNEKMEGNLTLYPRLGFSETGRRFEDGFARVYFRKELSPPHQPDNQ